MVDEQVLKLTQGEEVGMESIPGWRPDGTDAETLPCFTMPGAFRVASHPEVCNRGRDARTWPCNL